MKRWKPKSREERQAIPNVVSLGPIPDRALSRRFSTIETTSRYRPDRTVMFRGEAERFHQRLAAAEEENKRRHMEERRRRKAARRNLGV
jgi:hypothetical protein